MSIIVPFNGANYIIPTPNEVGWGTNLDNFFVAIGAGSLQKIGGNFTLANEVDFGSSFGLKSLYYKSRETNVSSVGILRLASASAGIGYRNNANSGNLILTTNAADQLTFNGVPIAGSSIYTINRAVITNGSGDLAVSTTTSTEIGYVSGVTSSIQTQLNTKATGSIASGSINQLAYYTGSTSIAPVTLITASKALVSDSNGLPIASVTTPTELAGIHGLAASKALVTDVSGIINTSTTTSTELFFLSGATSNIQTQLNAKATDSLVVHLAGTETITGSKTFSAAILTSNGSVSLPAIAPSADTATGFQFLNSNHSVDIVSNGVSLATFANDVSRTSQIKGASGIAVQLGSAISLVGADVTLTTSSKGLVLTDNTTNTVKIKATNTTTSWILSLPTTAGTNGFALITDGSGNTSWTSAGSGTVGSGTAGRLSLYNTSTNAITDTYVQNTHNITLAIATQASRSVDLALTIPNPGNAVTSANILLSEGTQTINGAQTLTSALTITPTTNQIVLGTTRTVTITAPTPATTSRTWTIPDISSDGTFTALEGTQTISGAKTFSNATTLFTGTPKVIIPATDAYYYIESQANSGYATLDMIGKTSGGTSQRWYAGLNTDASGSGCWAVYDVTGSQTSIVASRTSASVAIRGTTTNNNASTGFVGEYIESVVSTATNFPTSAQYGDLTSISLTAGDWDVSINGQCNLNGAVYTGDNQLGISTTSGNSSTGLVSGNNVANPLPPTATAESGGSIPSYRISLSTTTTVYYKYYAEYTGGPPKARGRISARRVR